MFKKTGAILLVIVLIVSVMAGCNNKAPGGEESSGSTPATSTGDKKVVNFWGHVNDAWNNSYKDIISVFNSSQEEIEVVPTFFPYNDFEAKIQTSLLSGGEGADLYEIWGGWAIDFIDADALSPVPDALMADLLEDCYEPVIGTYEGGDGHYYGVPLEYNIEYGGMIVNKPAFKEKAIAYPQTWDEMIKIAKDTSVENGELMEMRGIDYTTNDTFMTTILSMILSSGGEYLVDGKVVLNTKEGINAMQTLVDLIRVDHVTNLDSLDESAGLVSFEFVAVNEAMMVPRGPWAIASLEEDHDLVYGEDFEYVSMPFFGETKAFPSETGWGMCVPKTAKQADAAWVFVEYFLEPEQLIEHNIKCAQIPPRKSVAEDDRIAALEYAAPLIDILPYGKFIGRFNSDLMKDNFKQCFVSLVTDDGTYSSVADAMAKLEVIMNESLGLV